MCYVVTDGEFGIKLNNNKPEICSIDSCANFNDIEMAKKLFDNLPKAIKQKGFEVKELLICNKKLPDDIKCWEKRLADVKEVVKEAQKRREYLLKELSNMDKNLNNINHEIELISNLDMYGGYLLYVKQRKLLRERREIKDEIRLLTVMLGANMNAIAKNAVGKEINKMEERVYLYR